MPAQQTLLAMPQPVANQQGPLRWRRSFACSRSATTEAQSTVTSPGGDLRAALDKDGRRELVWDRRGQSVALDIARGLHFLHSHGVSTRLSASVFPTLC